MSNKFAQRGHLPGEDFRAADRLEITDLTYRYITAADLQDREMFADTLADRVLWDLTDTPVPLSGGPADFAAVTVDRQVLVDGAVPEGGRVPATGPRAWAQHTISNCLVTFTGPDEAEVFAYLRLTSYSYLPDDELRTMELAGMYHHTAIRTDGRWLLSAVRLSIRGYDPRALFAALPRRTPSS